MRPFYPFFSLNEISINLAWISHSSKSFCVIFSWNSDQNKPQHNDWCKKGRENRAESAPKDGPHPLTF